MSADRSADGVDNLYQEPTAILDAAAVAVRAFVGLIAQELIDQIAVGGVDLHAVKPGRHGVSRRLSILLDDAGNFGCFERARRGGRLKAFCREGLSLGPYGGGRDRRAAARLEGRVRDPPNVPELEHDAPPGDVDRFRHAFPTFDLLGAVDSGG